jgi:RimJ/RimL family protein N-acetyltransferase
MTTPECREFLPEDLLALSVDEHVKEQRVNNDVLAWGMVHKKAGMAETFTVDGKPVACGGFHFLWKGTAEMWLSMGCDCKPGVVLAVKRKVGEWIRDYSLDRVQAITPASWKKGQRFLEWLGFEREGLLRKLGPNGVDQMLYARLR